jgi:XTP/dITP diphosphohydrolase
MNVVFVTGNRHKFHEALHILSAYGIHLHQDTKGYIEIQSDSIEEIVLFGIKEVMKRARDKSAYIIEDAGLFIEALDGFPGPYSSYVYRTIGNRGILKLMEGVKNRRAKFVSCVGFCSKDSDPVLFKGEVYGNISWFERGSHGFGFDPIFEFGSTGKTFGEMTPDEKSACSHRFIALKKFANFFMEYEKERA